MSHRRSTAVAAALTAALALVACTEADNGNNTLAGRDQPSSSAPGAPQSTGAAEPAGGPVDLEAKDSEFVPKEIAAKAGDVTIVMKNTGKMPHTFTNTDLKADVNADGGKTAEIKLTGLKPGKYHFICKYHEALGMVGDLTVT